MWWTSSLLNPIPTTARWFRKTKPHPPGVGVSDRSAGSNGREKKVLMNLRLSSSPGNRGPIGLPVVPWSLRKVTVGSPPQALRRKAWHVNTRLWLDWRI